MRILGLVMAFSILLFACGDDDGGGDTSSNAADGGSDQVCSAVSDVQSSVTTVQNLDSGSSLTDVTNALSGVAQAGEDLSNAIQSAPSPDLDGLKSSVEDLENALKAVPSASSVQTGMQDVDKAADSVSKEAKTAADNAGCS
jgi:hypothetical protein